MTDSPQIPPVLTPERIADLRQHVRDYDEYDAYPLGDERAETLRAVLSLFTHEDVEALHTAAANLVDATALYSLADRIKALLPP